MARRLEGIGNNPASRRKGMGIRDDDCRLRAELILENARRVARGRPRRFPGTASPGPRPSFAQSWRFDRQPP